MSWAAPSSRPSTANGADMALGIPAELVELVAVRVAEHVAARLPDRPEPYLDVGEAAEYLRCKPKRIYELVQQDRVAHERDGRRLLFRAADLDAALERWEASV